MKVAKLYTSVVDAGIHLADSPETNSRVRAVNSFCVGISLTGLLYSVVFFGLSRNGALFGSSICFAGAFVIPIVLNHVNRPFASKVVFLLITNLLVLYFACAFGREAMLEIVGVLLVGFPFMIATRHEQRLLKVGLALPVLTFALLIITDYQLFPPIRETEEVRGYIKWSVIIISLIFNYAIYRLFSRQLDRLVDRVFDQYYELQVGKEEVLQHQEELVALNEQLATHHQHLEREVAARTQALSESEEHLKKSLADVETAHAQAKAANQAKSQFLANMSHEIRTPLNAIVGFSEIMLSDSKPGEVPADFLQYLENISMSGRNLSELINNVLDLSKIEAGKFNLSVGPVSVDTIGKSVYQINRIKALEKRVRFRYESDPCLPAYIETDRTMLNQIVMNLVSNAIKFTDQEKEVVLRICAEEGEENVLRFEVTDQGIGIPPERQVSIFEPFEQADNTITRKYGGTGLGLSITQKLVGVLGGEISLRSTVGQGSTFTITLPYRISTSLANAPEASSPILGNHRFATSNTVLLVEDNRVNQLVVTALFKRLGLSLHIASDGQEGIQRVEEMKPDLVLMDIHMPGMDGLEATRRLRQNPDYQDLPIIAMSADAFAEQQAEAKAAGMNDYTTKPIEFEKLIQLLSYYLKTEMEVTG